MAQDPYLDRAMRGWIVNISKRNYGRVANFEIEDLIQEGYLCYYKCRARYVGKPGLKKRDGTPCRFLPETDPDRQALRHFQSLVCTTFNNALSTLALKQPKGWEIAISTLATPDQSSEQAWEAVLPPDAEVATAAALLASAPKEIKQLFQILINDALELVGGRRVVGNDEWFVEEAPKRRGRKRETTNERYCRLLGLPSSYNVAFALERHFLK